MLPAPIVGLKYRANVRREWRPNARCKWLKDPGDGPVRILQPRKDLGHDRFYSRISHRSKTRSLLRLKLRGGKKRIEVGGHVPEA